MDFLIKWLNTSNNRKLLRAGIFIVMIISVFSGLAAIYIDLYTPGSAVARQYESITNYLLIFTLVLSLPLVFERLSTFEQWKLKYESLDEPEKNKVLWGYAKPLLYKVIGVFILAFIISIIFTTYGGISPEVVQNYQNYYSGASQHINMTINNNTLINLSFKSGE